MTPLRLLLLSSEPTGATFECSLDGGAFASCSSPTRSDARGWFAHVRRQGDRSGGQPLEQRGLVHLDLDAAAPVATIGDEAAAAHERRDADLHLHVDEPTSATFECSLDSAAFSACSTPKTYTTLADGSHNFAVKAIDVSGNHSATAASYTWTIDATPPTASLVTTPGVDLERQDTRLHIHVERDRRHVRVLDRRRVYYGVLLAEDARVALGRLAHVRGQGHRSGRQPLDDAASLTWIVDTVSPTVPGSFQLLGSNPRGFNDPPTFKFSNSSDTHLSGYQLIRDGQVTSASATPVAGGSETMTDSSIIADGSDDGVYHYSVRATGHRRQQQLDGRDHRDHRCRTAVGAHGRAHPPRRSPGTLP